jgi:beta-lactamase regulating signal transducer with metallopeptidase domain
MLCVLYVNVIGAFLTVVGLWAEKVFPITWPRRWLWCAIIGLSLFLPGYARTHNNSSVLAAIEHESGAMSWLDPSWFLRAESMNVWVQGVWATGTLLLLLLGIMNIARVSLLIRSARRKTTGEPDTVDGVPVIVTDSLGPATAGLFRARVVLPRWVLALPGTQRSYVVRHEAEHKRAHDQHLLFMMSLSLLLTPWNLALWWQLRRLRLAVEMDCDRRVVSVLGNPHAYGELLFKVAEASTRGPRLQPAFLGGGLLKERLTALLQPAQLRLFQKVLLPALAIGLLLLTLRMPHPVLSAGHQSHNPVVADR